MPRHVPCSRLKGVEWPLPSHSGREYCNPIAEIEALCPIAFAPILVIGFACAKRAYTRPIDRFWVRHRSQSEGLTHVVLYLFSLLG